MPFKSTIIHLKDRIDQALDTWLPPKNTPPRTLHEAMRYSVLSEGQRIRPTLLYLAHELYPSDVDPGPAAAAIECLHTFTLIHDDLPEMDNAHLRRGALTCHQKFSPAIALLAGDALHALAFNIIATAYYRTRAPLAQGLTQLLSQASLQVQYGQAADMEAEKNLSPREELKKELHFIHKHKTQSLITCSLMMGMHLNESTDRQKETMKKIGYLIGMAFQIIDDVLDITSTQATLGKDQGSDKKNGKLTHPSLYGLETSKQEVLTLLNKAQENIRALGGNSSPLVNLCNLLLEKIKH